MNSSQLGVSSFYYMHIYICVYAYTYNNIYNI